MAITINITNGDSAVEIMKQANIAGDFLPWRDVLHDGPVPKNLSLTELSQVRAKFISQCGWGAEQEIQDSFDLRDQQLTALSQNQNVVLWFEHDLYDQLQIIQILDWFHTNPEKHVNLSIICTDNYLGMLSPEQMKALTEFKVPVSKTHLQLASLAWSAFRNESPESWHALLDCDTNTLPFLDAAIMRLLQEYPSSNNGLSRNAQQALEIIAQGETKPGRVFAQVQEMEERKFLGDSSFWMILNELIESNPALLTLNEGTTIGMPLNPKLEISITPTGTEVLAGKQNWLDITECDKWIGGVHLKQNNIWCWDSNTSNLSKRV